MADRICVNSAADLPLLQARRSTRCAAQFNSGFLNTAFDSFESQKIESYHATADANPYYDTDQGYDTDDFVWLLSTAEVENYIPDKKARIAASTPYAYLLRHFAYTYKIRWALQTVGSISPERKCSSKLCYRTFQ